MARTIPSTTSTRTLPTFVAPGGGGGGDTDSVAPSAAIVANARFGQRPNNVDFVTSVFTVATT